MNEIKRDKRGTAISDEKSKKESTKKEENDMDNDVSLDPEHLQRKPSSQQSE